MGSPYALNWHGFRSKENALTAANSLMFAKNTRDIINALNNYEALPAAMIFATVICLLTLRMKEI
jgi:hypothetical protein